MDLLRLAVRVVFAYATLLLFVRLAGKRTVTHGSAFDFTFALIVGDLVDNLLWGEVAAATFVVAVGTLMSAHFVFDFLRYRSGVWR